MSCYNKNTFKVYGNKVELRKKEDTYVVDIYLKKEIIESFVSDEDANSKGESWARKTFFYLCDEGLIEDTSEISQAKVNISVKKH